jgi:hypothetical protein
MFVGRHQVCCIVATALPSPQMLALCPPSKAGLLSVGPPTCGYNGSPAILHRRHLLPELETGHRGYNARLHIIADEEN